MVGYVWETLNSVLYNRTSLFTHPVSERNPSHDKVWVQGAGTQRRPDLRGFLGTTPPSTPRPSFFHLLMFGILLCSLKTSLTLT